MATEFISREDAVQCSEDIANDLFEEGFESTSEGARIVSEWIKDIPAADVIPVEWIYAQVDKGKWDELVQRWRERNGELSRM